MKINHDFHIHTHLSLCADKSATAEAYAKIFKELGLKKAVGIWSASIEITDFTGEKAYTNPYFI